MKKSMSKGITVIIVFMLFTSFLPLSVLARNESTINGNKADQVASNVESSTEFEVDIRELPVELQKELGFDIKSGNFVQSENNIQARIYKPKVTYVHWDKKTIEKYLKKSLGSLPTVGNSLTQWGILYAIGKLKSPLAVMIGLSLASANTALNNQKKTLSNALALTKKKKAKGIKWTLTPNPNSYPKVRVSMSVWK